MNLLTKNLISKYWRSLGKIMYITTCNDTEGSKLNLQTSLMINSPPPSFPLSIENKIYFTQDISVSQALIMTLYAVHIPQWHLPLFFAPFESWHSAAASNTQVQFPKLVYPMTYYSPEEVVMSSVTDLHH